MLKRMRKNKKGFTLAELLIVVAQISSVKNMVVIPTIVEADQLIAEQLLNFCGRRIDHSRTGLGLIILPVHQKEIWKYLNVKEDQTVILILPRSTLTNIIGLQLQLLSKSQAVLRLIRALHSKLNNRLIKV